MKIRISIEFLDKFHGSLANGLPAWPPDPYRLFQAILASNASIGPINADAELTLRWLESCQPPIILANQPIIQKTFYRYVPNNDIDSEKSKKDEENSCIAALYNHQRNASTPKKYCPRLPQGLLHYVWDADDNTPVSSIASAVAKITYLGKSIDNVLCECSTMNDSEYTALLASGVRKHSPLLPSPTGLRIPVKGSFDRLVKIHDNNDGSTQVFSRIGYSEFGEPQPFAPFMLRIDGKTAAFNLLDACIVSSRLRGAAISWTESNPFDFIGGSDKFVAGHAPVGLEQPLKRFSYIPLPSFGIHTNGAIRRVLISAPVGCHDAVFWAKKSGDRKPIFSNDNSKERKIVATLDSMDPKDKMLEMYSGTSSQWASVLPVVLPACDRNSEAIATKMAIDCFKQAGIGESDVLSFELRKDPYFPGTVRATERFFLPKHHLGKSLWHMKIKFNRYITGPFVLGSARHAGLGVFSAV